MLAYPPAIIISYYFVFLTFLAHSARGVVEFVAVVSVQDGNVEMGVGKCGRIKRPVLV